MNIIAENRARMNALGLHQLAKNLMGSVEKITQPSLSKKTGKRRVGEEFDEEYMPAEEEEGLSSSSKDDEEYANDGDDVSLGSQMITVICVCVQLTVFGSLSLSCLYCTYS